MNIEDKRTTAARHNEESDRAIAEFLAKGNTIQQVEAGKSGQIPGQETSVWGRRVPKQTIVVPKEDE
jgi:hypothetical protein